MLKKGLILLTVLSFAVVANGALAPFVEMLPSGDMENGGDATTPPLWWSSVGLGTHGVSSDTPLGSPQSLIVDDGDGTATTSYSHDYTDQSGYAVGTQIQISFWLKGDSYTSLGVQGGGAVTKISGDGNQWVQGIDWTYYETIYEVTTAANGFSWYLYDNSDGGLSAQADNVSFMVIPEPATMTLIGLGGLALIRRRK